MHTPAVGADPKLQRLKKIHILQRLLGALISDIHILKNHCIAFFTHQGAGEQKRAIGVDDDLLADQALRDYHRALKRSL